MVESEAKMAVMGGAILHPTELVGHPQSFRQVVEEYAVQIFISE